jgi:cob(I)alamin adenosyltransferase
VGHRLSKIYTRTGDDGSTGLGDGSRIPKDSLRVEALGTLDELNSQIGLVLALEAPSLAREALDEIQHLLFDLGGELSLPDRRFIEARHTLWLEQQLDLLNDPLPPLKEFILPGGSPAAAACHVARAVCRRAERILAALQRQEALNPHALAFINRLSDYLFVAARVLAREQGGEVLWRGRAPLS